MPNTVFGLTHLDHTPSSCAYLDTVLDARFYGYIDKLVWVNHLVNQSRL